MPGKVHADDIPVPVRGPDSGKNGQPGCGSTSVMTVTPVHRCPRRSGSRTVRTGKVSIHKITGRLQRCASGRCLRWLPGVIRIRQNNGSRVYGSCRRKIHDVHARAPPTSPRKPCSVSVNCMPSRRGPGLFSRTASGGKKSQSRATDAVTV